MGVSSTRAGVTEKLWVYRMVTVFCVAVILLAFPLQRALERNIEQGKAQPSSFPLTISVMNALLDHIEETPGVRLMSAGRPNSTKEYADVVLFLSTPDELPVDYADELVRIVRYEMNDPRLKVEVHCLRSAWQSSTGDD
jgi:hypothetical protein